MAHLEQTYEMNEEMEREIKRSRPQALLDVLSTKYKQLILLGVIFAFSLAPIATYRFLIVAQSVELDGAVAAGNMTSQEALIALNAMQNQFYLICLLLVQFTAIALSGGAKVVKCLAFKESTPFRDNFGEGVRENALGYSCCLTANILVLWACNFVLNSKTDYSLWFYLPRVGWLLLIVPISLWFLSSVAVYKNKLIKTLSVSARLYALTMPSTLLFEVLAVSPFALLLLPTAIVQLLVPLLYALILLPVVALCWAFVANSGYDKYINAKSFPELVGKGL